ncbi:molybdenum cofactor guanylyltransferase MobA [Ahrensia sp. R2A130]|uniref:molybdenum cofactor guanylyltransferase MobA n=1 Tax=Ahrensia sp. R2A130 TaxID=744979 RepID=UPI0001E0F077|nr:molybdenum cofactor guanylyltransferase MobA [Ahrensia sp. R2A130]EFL90433.1 molybdopterin-guanine dinucleotide biosynthesis protein A [Ahrensia sp. R2A130]
MIAGIILAGGLSRRMGGQEKSLMTLGGRPAISLLIERLAPQVKHLAINANGDPERFADEKLPVLADTVQGHVGPLAGVLTGMEWAAEQGASHVISGASDTPFIPLDLVERLSESAGDGIAMARSGGRVHPVFGLWPVSLVDDLRHFLVAEDKRKILEFAKRYELSEVEFDMDDDPFFNINTPEDLDIARKRLGL